MSLRTPLGRVRGLGSARDGTHHWIAERVTALALVPLSLWLVWSILGLTLEGSYTTDVTDPAQQALLAVHSWLQAPLHALAMILFILFSLYHSMLGVQVITEDYVHKKGYKFTLLIINTLVHYVFILAGLFAVAKIHFFTPPLF